MRRWALFVAAFCALTEGCGDDELAGFPDDRTGANPDGGVGASPANADGGARGDAGAGPGRDGSTGNDGGTVGAIEGGVDSGLPPLPELTNVLATLREDSVGIDFDPVDDAVDYRVYALPALSDVTTNADGSLTIKNAIYHCAGIRQSLDVPNNVGNDPSAPAGQAYWNPPYNWPTEVPAQPIVGYVYPTGGPDRVAVYAVGVYPTDNELGWRESRSKIYTTDANARQTLLSQRGRDDGIVFYVPSAASAATETVYHSEVTWGNNHFVHYFGEADKAGHTGDTTPPQAAFQVLKAPAPDAVPLHRVQYKLANEHTELAVGKERFKRAVYQGSGPLWHLEWTGVTGPTTLVVEALKNGCPYQGLLSPEHLSAPPHQTLLTLDDIQKASPSGEVFINGQYDLPGTAPGGLAMMKTPNASPVPLARSYVQVTPQPHNPADWDWYQGFNVGTTLPAATPSADPGFANDQASAHWTSSLFDFGAYAVDNPGGIKLFAHGLVLGQMLDVFDDWAQDVTGRVRFTAQQKANIAADASKFLHVTWSVNIVGSDRRYPQLIVSDQSAPIEDGFSNPQSNTLLIQTISGPSMRLEVQAFHGLVGSGPWAVNNQAKSHTLVDQGNVFGGASDFDAIGPAELPFEHAGLDRMTRFDAYVSSGMLYVFMDGNPAGCMQYPSNGFALNGSVTVTFGDVLYHEGAEDVCQRERPYVFLHAHQCTETKRTWDDLGFKSGVAAPAWDAARFPCRAY